MINNITEIGPRAFGRPDIEPDLKVGDLVFVGWSNHKVYKAKVVDYNKEAISVGVQIEDDTWPYPKDNARVPSFALVKRNLK
jgi:hypothetical protein